MTATCCSIRCASAAFAPAEAAATARPFYFTHLAFSPNGHLIPAQAELRSAVTSLYYGGPMTNVVFTDTASSVPRTSPAPARPAGPRYDIERWTSENGLSANKVNALFQTRDGYLWIGTIGGLARFDGTRFVSFDESNTPEMKANGSVVRALWEDDEARLWIGTDRGVLCYSAGRFVGFAGQEQFRGKHVRCVAFRAAGGFWIGGDQGVGYRDRSGAHWCDELRGGKTNRVFSLLEGPGRVLWAGTTSGLFEFDRDAHVVKRSFLTEEPAVTVAGLMLDRRKRLWIGSNRGVWRLDSGETNPVSIGETGPGGLSTAHNARFAEDSEGNIWATTGRGRGVICIPRDGNRFDFAALAPEISETTCVLQDREGAIWTGTQYNGLARLRRQLFATFTFVGDGMLDNFRSVTEGADGSLWFASRAGLIHWTGHHLTLLDARLYSPRRISSVCVGSSGWGWAGFPSGGVFDLPREIGEPLLEVAPTACFPELGYVQVLYPDHNRILWLGTAKGLYRLKEGKTLEQIDGLSSSDVRAVLEDGQGSLWIGTAGRGLNRMTRDRIDAFTTSHGLPDDRVGALHESADGSLWIGTDAGLCRLRDGQFVSFTPESGVPQTGIQRIVEDTFGRLWLGHAAGISRVERKQLDAWVGDRSRLPAVADFGKADGILNAEGSDGSQPSVVKGMDGRLWFPTRGGLAVIDPADCRSNVPPPQILIEHAVFDGEALPTGTRLELGPGRGRHVEFRFTATSLHSPERVRLQYQLDGHDSGWRDCGSVRLATYANLGPGAYQFRVRARNHEGRWSERDAVFPFRVASHFWQTWLFYGVAGLVVPGVAVGLITWRLGRERRAFEAKRLQALELERRRIARDMHDHLGAQLAGIALAAGGNESAHQHVRESLRELNDLIWAVHPDNDTLPSLADFIANFAVRYLASAGLELNLDLPEQIPARGISSRLRHEVAAMFKEALRNVTQHARARRVVVRLRIQRDKLLLTVRDDGRGFDPVPFHLAAGSSDMAGPPDQKAGGNGLRNFMTRSEAVGGKCQIRSVPGDGTEIEFIVPLRPPEAGTR